MKPADVYRRAANILESYNDKWCTLIGCCEAIDEANGDSMNYEKFCIMFKPEPRQQATLAYWWPLDLEHVLPRLIALDLMALIAEDM